MKQLLYKLTSALVITLLVFGTTLASALINPPTVHAAGSMEVVINELMWMGSTESGFDEWIELKNNTDQTVDLAGWQLTNAATVGDTLTIPSGIIPARGFFLISNFPETSASSILNIAPDYRTPLIALSNTCAPIDLVRPEEEEEETVVDSMGCNGTKYFEGVNNNALPLKQSMERTIVLADGDQAESWQTSVGFVNLDATAAPSNFATPKIINDNSKPLEDVGSVNDGLMEDRDFTATKTEYPVSWSGFSDPESGIAKYQLQIIRLGAVGAEVSVAVTVTDPTVKNYTFLANQFTSSPEAELGGLQEGMKYEARIRATNGAGITGAWEDSDDIVVDSQNPAPPPGVTVTDTPSDNGGSVRVSWQKSTSVDEITYEVSYKEQSTPGAPTVVGAGAGLELVIGGLKTNNKQPVIYQFEVRAIDFSLLKSPPATASGFPLDNQAPILDETKVTVNQNRPGTVDSIFGAAGSVNESSTVMVFDRLPSEPGAKLLNSIESESNGAFMGLGIGDNLNGKVWLTLEDKNGLNSSPAKSFANDIIGPNAPTLLEATSECVSENCRVVLRWADNGPDTATYRVARRTDAGEILTFELTGLGIALDLPGQTRYEFTVIAIDKYGNPSVRSNLIALQLTSGVKTVAQFQGGQVVTQTEAIPGAKEVITVVVPQQPATLVPLTIVEKAEAAAPAKPTPTTPPVTSQIAPEIQVAPSQTNDRNDAGATGQDWTRIFVVVILLLIVAGSFYALSRSFGADRGVVPDDNDDRPKPPENNQTPPAAGKRRRGRPRKQSSNQPK